MKRLQSVLVPFMGLLLLTSCLDTEIKTVVHEDGTFTRTITFTSDSATIAERKFKLPLDTVWSLTVAKLEPKKWALTAERTFATTEEMNLALQGTRGKHYTSVVEFEKQFQWFFTRYRYLETFKCYRLVNAVPMERYVSNEEIDIFVSHEINKKPYSPDDSVKLAAAEKRFEEWQKSNLFEAYYNEFLKGVTMLKSPRLTPEKVTSMKRVLYEQTADSIMRQNGQYKQWRQGLMKVLRTPDVGKAFLANRRGFDSLLAEVEFQESGPLGSFKLAVTMPGLITSTNSESMEGNTVRWENFISQAYLRDTKLSVESQSVNWWAVIGSGIVILMILAYFVASLLRKK